MGFIGGQPASALLTSSDIANDTVNADKIADDSISEEHIDNTAITGFSALTSLADTDKFLVSDASDSNNLKYVEKQYLGGGGKINQLLNTTSNVNTTTSVDAELISLAITPSATSSKIYMLFTGSAQLGANEYASWDFYRGSLSSGTKILDGGEAVFNGYNNIRLGFSMSFLDSPNTTSATTYTVVGSAVSGSIQYGATGRNTLTLMEVLA